MNENAPVVGSKAMFATSPVAESTTVPPVPEESLADTVNCNDVPTVAFWGPGTRMTGRIWAVMSTVTTVILVRTPLVAVMTTE